MAFVKPHTVVMVNFIFNSKFYKNFMSVLYVTYDMRP